MRQAEVRPLLALLFAKDERRLRAAAPTTEDGWRDVHRTCLELGAAGLLHTSLRRTGCSSLPPDDVQAAIRRAHAANTVQNMALEAEARRVLSALRAAHVLAAPMKGVALFVESVVVDVGVRPTSDFDFATLRHQRADVLRVLDELGYAEQHRAISWKHLPARTRGDITVEVHEIAYWHPRTRAVLGATELAAEHRPTRLGRLCALQVHHLVLGSPRDPGLLIRTLADVRAFLALAEDSRELRDAIVAGAAEAGMLEEVAALDAILADVRGEPSVLGLSTSARMQAALLDVLTSPLRGERIEALAHALRVLPVQPFALTRELVSVLAFPSRDFVAASEGAERDSWTVMWRRIRRPAALLYRIVRALPETLRDAGRGPPR